MARSRGSGSAWPRVAIIVNSTAAKKASRFVERKHRGNRSFISSPFISSPMDQAHMDQAAARGDAQIVVRQTPTGQWIWKVIWDVMRRGRDRVILSGQLG